MLPALPLIGSVVSGITSFFNKKQEIKKAKVSADAKLKLMRETGDQSIELTDAEWESLSVKTLTDSWKDEYVTIIVTSPIIGYIAGGIWFAFTGDMRLIEGVDRGVTSLNALGLDWALLTSAVVFAAVGLKVWRGNK